MHIGAAVGTRLVALFAGHDPRDCGPYVPENQFAVLRAEDMPKPELGLAAISPEKVFEACKPFLP
jgi:ADP-heptose:LPS heptosyltransferase